jgi:hypothetical protein
VAGAQLFENTYILNSTVFSYPFVSLYFRAADFLAEKRPPKYLQLN